MKNVGFVLIGVIISILNSSVGTNPEMIGKHGTQP